MTTQTPAHRNIDTLDGVRGLACLMVVLGHLAKEDFIFDIKGIGQLGVMLFFVLSGFLMAHLYLVTPLSPVRFGAYAFRRIFRVVPAYVVVAFVSYVLYQYYADFGYAVDKETLIGLLTLSTQLSVFWTIPVEMKFYAFFPVLWLLLGYIRQPWLKGSILLVAIIVWLYTDIPTLLHLDLPRTRLTLTKHIEYFLGGMAAAYLSLGVERFCQARSPWRLSLVNAGFIFTLTLIVILVPQVFLHLFGIEHHMWDNSNIIAPVFIACITLAPNISGMLGTIFTHRFARYLGAISFSLYLVHYPCIKFVHDAASTQSWPTVFRIMLALFMAGSVASVMFYSIEQPFRRFGARLARALPAEPHG